MDTCRSLRGTFIVWVTQGCSGLLLVGMIIGYSGVLVGYSGVLILCHVGYSGVHTGHFWLAQ